MEKRVSLQVKKSEKALFGKIASFTEFLSLSINKKHVLFF